MCCSGAFAAGAVAFRTTPEDADCVQPVDDRQAQLVGLFDGRIDNRETLTRALGLARPGDAGSDAELALRVYRRWREQGLNRLLGPYVLLIYDLRRRELLLARDPLSERGLYYYCDRRLLLAATEPAALLHHPAVSPAPDERRCAAFFANYWPADGSSFFSAVRELPPGHHLRIAGTTQRLRQHWRLPDAPQLRYRHIEDYAEQFRELLGQAVAARLRSTGPVAISLSGGLDSASIAALAVRQGVRPQAFSWRFNELVDCDESVLVTLASEFLGLELTTIDADRLWPLAPQPHEPVSLNTPWANSFAPLLQALYRHIAAAGYRVVLRGDGADELYLGMRYWLRDLLRCGHWRELIRGSRYCLADLHNGGRAALRRLLPRAGIDRRRQTPPAPAWLTELGQALCPPRPLSPLLPARPGALDRYFSALDLVMTGSYQSARRLALLTGLERRNPYRDRRLVEFMLRLPAWLLYRHGETKPLARAALRGLLPEALLRSPRVGVLYSLYRRGLRRESVQIVPLLTGPDATWPRYVRRERLATYLAGGEIEPANERLLWQCVSYELWRNGLRRAGFER